MFALTGFMGYTLGPILNADLAMPNGGQVVMMAIGGTATVFLGVGVRTDYPQGFQLHER